MKVTNTVNSQLQGINQKKSDKLDKLGNKTDKEISKADFSSSSEVALSERARDAKKAKEIAKNSSPEIDEAKVAKFQKLIDSGNYKVDAKKVADKLVDENLMNSLASDGE